MYILSEVGAGLAKIFFKMMTKKIFDLFFEQIILLADNFAKIGSLYRLGERAKRFVNLETSLRPQVSLNAVKTLISVMMMFFQEKILELVHAKFNLLRFDFRFFKFNFK